MGGEKLKKTLVSVVLDMALMASALLGCGVQNPQPDQIETVAENDTEKRTDSNLETIRVATWYDSSYTANLRAYLARRFPNYKIEFVYIDKAHYEPIIDAEFTFNGAPDIIYVDQVMAKKNARNGNIIPLTEYCSNFEAESLEAFWYDKDTYAVPSTTCFECIYLNQGIFDKFGIKEPHNNEEFIAMCDFIRKAKRMKPLSAGMMDYEAVSSSAQSILQVNFFGTEYGSEFGARLRSGRSIFHNDLNEYLSDWEMLLKHQIFTADMYTMDKQAAIEEFVAEKSLMLIGGPEDYNRIRVANPQMELGTLPTGWGRYGPIMIGGCNCGFAVNANSKNLDTAKEVVVSLTNNEGQFAIWKDRVGSRSYLKKTYFDNPVAFEGIEEVFAKNQLYMPVLQWGDSGSDINMIFGKELQQVLRGKEPINMALMQVDIKVNNMYDK
ncbi:multiple sugar transport system substrate-binding protein [Butyrivibrio proteoclasticus]|uniref:Multiple sugar transport system substrate-binding protein n=1 Tax=Butyrivibrio proteoclasticus TaxID=43305 RepID=A0A1I5TTS9_9FIRM|nr:extracellular solute-binding protein [Butyrivibrio proteoclasticus]SFP86388.1 multiple sugar transport system substrate-binding protein [Butyrivibrio proteoclasticus]